ncbi:MAG TPA: glucose-6-phosphate isomerase [Solirubrobacteraceae bacterium]|nr:glucose-6-phosphate isomerase [Solirubrobacteraceae bacterium]
MAPGASALDRLPSWPAVETHARELSGRTLRDLFDADPGRADALTFEAEGLLLDVTRQRVTSETLALLVRLAREAGLEERIAAMFAGEHINVSEDRAVLHVALRAPRGTRIATGGEDVVGAVHDVLDRMADLAERVRSGAWRGATGARIRTIVNVGIGGSYLGPEMAALALDADTPDDLEVRFLSNVDGSDVVRVTRGLDPSETLVIIASKTFTTLETMTNAHTMRDWITAALGEAAVAQHMVALSTNTEGVAAFGIDPDNMFGFWDWVGGRYSMDSAIGLSTMIAIGPAAFGELLAGFHAIDEHLRTAPLEENLPVLLGLLGVWNRNLMGHRTVAVLPYAQELARFPAYLQQLEMESNGKHVMLDGTPVRWDTSPVLWGEPGTNGQHSFHQLLHQGTEIVPAELLAFTQPRREVGLHHDLLMANLLGQAEALAFGRSAEQLRALGIPEDQVPHRVCEGDRPSSVLLVDGPITPRALGMLVALYEHRALTEGVLWGIDSFDQWGVELGKVLAGAIADELTADAPPDLGHDPATNALVRRLRAARGRAV